MSILVDRQTRVLIQGITGKEGSFHTRQMIEYGTQVVAGVTPGKRGETLDGVPVFNTVAQAVEATHPTATMVFVPPRFAADAILEAGEAGIELVICLTEGIPIHDMLTVRAELDRRGTALLGPNTPGIISPGKTKLGLMAGYIHKEGSVGILSRSGTLTYEVVHQLSRRGIGQSTCAGIGGDPIIGLTFTDLLARFEADAQTQAVILIGEIGGTAEEEAASYISERFTKPVVSFIAGRTAPPGRRMGHAGAIISGGKGTAKEKAAALREAGVLVVENPGEIGAAMAGLLEA